MLAKDHTGLAAIYFNLGALYKSLRKFKECEEYYLKCIRVYEIVLLYNSLTLASI
jgi:hypothetical protein